MVLTIGEMTDDLLGSDDFPSLTTETWRDVQGRAAVLLPDELSVALTGYYARLQTLMTLRNFEKRDDERLKRAWAQTHSELFGMEFAGSRNPWSEYLNAMLEAQDAAREQIIGYLALPWDARLLLRVVRWLERLRRRVRRGKDAQPGS